MYSHFTHTTRYLGSQNKYKRKGKGRHVSFRTILKNRMNSSFSSNHPGAIHPSKYSSAKQLQRGKELNKFRPPNISDDLLPFLLSLSFFYSMFGKLYICDCNCNSYNEQTIHECLLPLYLQKHNPSRRSQSQSKLCKSFDIFFIIIKLTFCISFLGVVQKIFNF